MEISDMHTILRSDPIDTCDLNIGNIASQYYDRTNLLSSRYEITRLLYDHTRYKIKVAQFFWHCQPVAISSLSSAHEYTRVLSRLTGKFLEKENELLVSPYSHSIDWLTNTRTLHDDGIRFLNKAIEETGHFFAGLSQNLSETDARVYSQKIMARYEVIKNQDFLQAARLTQDISDLVKADITTR